MYWCLETEDVYLPPDKQATGTSQTPNSDLTQGKPCHLSYSPP